MSSPADNRATREPLLYRELAPWWPLLSPPSHYVEEASSLLPLLRPADPAARLTLLELGSGGGSLAWHLKPHFSMTLTDRSPDMLAVNRAANPECEHLVGDMRTLDLGRTFDRVLIHDAITYATTEADLAATLSTARRHCHGASIAVFIPDHVKETFAEDSSIGGENADDGRGLRYLEWAFDPDPDDTTIVVHYTFLCRERDGTVRTYYDLHVEGLFPSSTWRRLLERAGFERVEAILDPWNRYVFVAHPGVEQPVLRRETGILHS